MIAGIVHQRTDIAHILTAVGFHIRLVDDVKAQTVAKLVETRVIGIVGGTDAVDVVFLH